MADVVTTAFTTSYLDVSVSPDPGFKLVFDSIMGTEELGRPFLYELMMSSVEARGDLMSLLGSSATVTLSLPGRSRRYINGIITRIAYAGLQAGAFTYRIELRPWIWLLTQAQDCKIFQNKSPFDIVTGIFTAAGFSDFEDKRQNSAGNMLLDYCVQYRETSYAFVTRLMEQYGIYYYFNHSDGKHTLIFADDPNSHPSVGDAIPFQSDETEVRVVEDHIWQWSSDLTVMPGKFTFRDYNFTTPTADLTSRTAKAGNHQYGTYEVYDYPGLYDTTGNGQKLADVRMQDYDGRRKVLHGTSNSRRLYAGCKFTLSHFYQDSENVEYTVIAATRSLAMASAMAVDTAGSQQPDAFTCVFQAIPATTPYRLERLTPLPMIRGPQTAKVVGQSGDEVTTDQYGRIKVKFFWDRSDTQDENSSCWIRVAQSWAGAGWGRMVIPRIGQEVVVEFLEGNPDRPLVTGCVYNVNQTVPYKLPDNKTRSTFKTNSSIGGGGYNELRFEDKAGSEEVYFQAQKDYNLVVVTGNGSIDVKQGDYSHTVWQGSNSCTVSQGNNSCTVSQGNNSCIVSQGDNSCIVSAGSDSLIVSKGCHSIDVTAGSSTYNAGQSITITANKSITLQVGMNSITIDASGVSVNGKEISAAATGNMTMNGLLISLN
jgi:type VI secretion system secreted protein VgrG